MFFLTLAGVFFAGVAFFGVGLAGVALAGDLAGVAFAGVFALAGVLLLRGVSNSSFIAFVMGVEISAFFPPDLGVLNNRFMAFMSGVLA